MKSNIWKMYVIRFLRSFHFIGGVLVIFFTDWGQISVSQALFLQSLFSVFIVFLEIPSGAMADYFGRKQTIVLASLIVAVASVIYSSYPLMLLFIIGEFLFAFSNALFSGTTEALVYDTLKQIGQEDKSKRIFGRLGTFEMVAIMTAAPIGSLIAHYFGLRYTMMFMAVPFLLGGILALTLKEPQVEKKPESYLKMVKSGWHHLKNHKVLQILSFDAIAISTLSFAMIWMYQPLLKEINVPIAYFGFVHAAISGSQIIFMNSFGWLEKSIGGKRKYLLLSAIIPGLAFILIGLFSYLVPVIIMLVLISGFGLSRKVLFQSYMNKYIESGNRATVVSTISVFQRLFQALILPVVGLIMEKSISIAFMMVGIAVLGSAYFSKVEEQHLMD